MLNSEGGAWDYNPYVYANNNPYKYIDRNGEIPLLIPVMIGGFAFAAANFDHIDNLFEFVGSFACGAFATYVSAGVSIGVGAVVGGAVTAGCAYLGAGEASPFIGAAVGAAAGYLTYNLTYSALTGTPFHFSWSEMGIDMGIAVATVGMGVIANKFDFKLSKIMQTRHRPLKTGPDAMAAKAEAGKAITPSAEASEVAKETGMQARQSSAAMHSNAGLLERTGKSVTTFTGEVYISKSDPHYLELLKEAQARYPNKAGHIQLHHVDPKYMGGPSNGKLIPLDAAYHQMITNEFRSIHPYGTRKILDGSVRHGIMQKVYMKYPLPQ